MNLIMLVNELVSINFKYTLQSLHDSPNCFVGVLTILLFIKFGFPTIYHDGKLCKILLQLLEYIEATKSGTGQNVKTFKNCNILTQQMQTCIPCSF